MEEPLYEPLLPPPPPSDGGSLTSTTPLIDPPPLPPKPQPPSLLQTVADPAPPPGAPRTAQAEMIETFWDRWGTILMLLCSVLILAALAWFGFGVYRYVAKIQNGETIDISQFAISTDSSSIIANNAASVGPVDSLISDYADDPKFGKVGADITIVMFEDFECPYCGRSYPILKRVMEKYKGEVEFVYRDFPLSSIHPNAEKAAQAGNCAYEQGKFWEYHDILYSNQGKLGEADLKNYARQLGLDTTDFNLCLDSGKFVDEVDKDFSDGLRSGVSGTPTFFVNGNKVQGVISEAGFDQIIQYFKDR